MKERQDYILHKNETLCKDIRKTLDWVNWNAYGIDLSGLFEEERDFQKIQAMLSSTSLSMLRKIYLLDNTHNVLHWYLDSPYRYYTPRHMNKDANDIFQKLQTTST